MSTPDEKLLISAVGDIAFRGKKLNQPSPDIFGSIREYLSHSSVVIGNLEGPLCVDGMPVPNKCTLSGNPDWSHELARTGFNVVSLANNHIMDLGEEALFNTMETLESAGIQYVGAGADIIQARKAVIIENGNTSIGILARSAVIVSSRCYAQGHNAGVAFFDIQDTINDIKAIRNNVDIVLLTIHWGLENYIYPSPSQRKDAEILLRNGVDILIGHHPHVVQGIELSGPKMIAYSLGNFLFAEFDWPFQNRDGITTTQNYRLSEENKHGLLLNIEVSTDKTITYTPVHTYINEDNHIVVHPKQDIACHKIRTYKPVFNIWYKLSWFIYSARKEWQLRLSQDMSFGSILRNIHRIRFHHLGRILRSIKNSVRIIFERSTNPYD